MSTNVLQTAVVGVVLLALAKIIRVAFHTPWLNRQAAKACVGCGRPVRLGVPSCPDCGAQQDCTA